MMNGGLEHRFSLLSSRWEVDRAVFMTVFSTFMSITFLPACQDFLWQQVFVGLMRVTADYAVLAEQSRGLSGGDILNVCVNAIYEGSVDADPAKWLVTQGMLEREIAKAKKAKAEHSGEKGKNRRRIGFGVG